MKNLASSSFTSKDSNLHFANSILIHKKNKDKIETENIF